MSKKTFKALIGRAKERDAYWAAKATFDFTEDLVRLMEQREISKADLAKRIKSSPAYITKVLRGDTNFTIETMVRLVRAVNGQLCIHVGKREDHVRWIDVVRERVQPAVVWARQMPMISYPVNEDNWNTANVSDTAAA